jgi:Domain of unknown function (DUF4337)
VPELEMPNAEELEERKGKAFTRRVALVTATYAVFLAVISLGGSDAMKEMLLAQQQASDQWSFYQAKVVREHLYRNQKLKMDLELLERGASMKPEVRQRFESRLKKTGDEESRFNTEKKRAKKRLNPLKKERDLNRAKDPYFDYAEVLLQISIILASIAILSPSGLIFIFSLISAALGTILSINGFFMIFRIPFLG